MPLAAGSKIGAYEIVSAIGAGGMGEVYRAKDSKLKREVAIKVLPADVAGDRERLARFQREAEVLASLNHPHIAQVYGIEDTALVMELVEGDDLAERIRRGAIPLDEALPIAKQIAEALEAAHDQGIIHRDLKPANVKVRPDGTVKVLDFGLAKALQDPKSSSPQAIENSPTITSPAMTMRGVILGTAAYMAPEQAKGKAVDKRADIWAFGCVLYEMLSGTRAFKGDDVTDIITSVMRDTPAWNALPDGTPATIRTLLRRCLEKDPRNRAPHMAVARMEIADAMSSTGELVGGAPVARSRGLSIGMTALLVIAAMGVAGGVAWLARSPAPAPPRSVIRAAWPYAEGRSLRMVVQRNQLAMSRNGGVMAGIGSNIWVKRMDQLSWGTVPGSADATSVFLSPDGEWVGYLTRTGIGKARTTGGAGSQLLALNLPNFGPIAASWGDDGRIYFADERGIHAVPAGGGPVATIVTVENVTAVHVLPGSQALLYSRGRIQDKTEVVLHAIGGDGIVLGEGLTPRFVPPDTVLWVNDDSVKAARLDLAARRLLSAPVLALEDKVARLSAFAQYDVSEDGTIVFVPAGSAGQPDSTPAIRARTGTIRTLTAIVHQYSDPRLSPDGRRLALHLSDLENDVWVLDLDRGALTRITHHPEEDETPVWSADGQWIAFSGSSRSSSGRSVFRRRADGSGGEEELWTGGDHTHVTDWSRDGRVLLLESAHAQRRSDVLLLDVAGKATTPLIATAFNESSARLSPDGRWIAYQSDESGQLEVYVQSFPALDRKVQVSTQGGVQPVWARDGTAVHFRTDTTMESSRFHVVDGSPRAEAPVKQFDDTFVQPQGSTHTTYDVMADGSTIVFQPPSRGSTSTTESHIIGVFNWIDEVRAKLPPR